MYKLESNPLHDAFFSNANYSRIMGYIKELVQRRTGTLINPWTQNSFDLYNIMWSVYSVNSFNYSADIEYQINKMNAIVINKAADQIVSGMTMYKQYMHDIYTMPVPGRLPISTTQYGKKFGADSKI